MGRFAGMTEGESGRMTAGRTPYLLRFFLLDFGLATDLVDGAAFLVTRLGLTVVLCAIGTNISWPARKRYGGRRLFNRTMLLLLQDKIISGWGRLFRLAILFLRQDNSFNDR